MNQQIQRGGRAADAALLFALIASLGILRAHGQTPSAGPALPRQGQAIIADHTTAKPADFPVKWVEAAKKNLVVAYGHTSHGSQLVSGLDGLEKWLGPLYSVRPDGSSGSLQLRDNPFEGAGDLGNPDFSAWAAATRKYLKKHPEVNVVMWSWCGQVSGASEADINGYLENMDRLEKEFPGVRFVYFTGHLDGTGPEGNLHRRNEQIRAFVKKHGKILYDFADIEAYDPDGRGYLERKGNDNCDYDSGNWAVEWQKANPGKWFPCNAAHSQPLNGNLKAYAAWHLFARLAGWK